MKSEEEKAHQKQQLKNFHQKGKENFIAGLPATPNQFKELFDFVDERVSEDGCDDTLKFTLEYLNKTSLSTANIILWLEEQGCYCDCEIFNIEEKFEGL